MNSLQSLVFQTLKPFRAQKAYKEALLFCDWENIVGTDFSRQFMPAEIYSHSSGKVLKLITSSSGMATVRYMEPVLLERINQFFGFPYISKLRTVQGQIKKNLKKSSQQNEVVIKNLEEALQIIGKHLNVNRYT